VLRPSPPSVRPSSLSSLPRIIPGIPTAQTHLRERSNEAEGSEASTMYADMEEDKQLQAAIVASLQAGRECEDLAQAIAESWRTLEESDISEAIEQNLRDLEDEQQYKDEEEIAILRSSAEYEATLLFLDHDCASEEDAMLALAVHESLQ